MNWMYCLRWVWHMLRYSCKVTGIIMYISNMYTLYIDKDSIELQTFSVQRWLCMLPPLLHCMTTHKHFNVTWARVRMLGRIGTDGRTGTYILQLYCCILTSFFFSKYPCCHFTNFRMDGMFRIVAAPGTCWRHGNGRCFENCSRRIRCNSRFWAQWDTLQSRYFCFF